MVEVTGSILEEGKSVNGGWSRKQLDILGIPWPPPKDWRTLLKGKLFDDREIDQFLELRDHHVRAKAIPLPVDSKRNSIRDTQRKRKRRWKEARTRSSSKLDGWAQENRIKLLTKKNEAEEHIDLLLANMPIRYRRERGIKVGDKLYYMDFLITSILNPRRKIRVCLEIDGGYHTLPSQIAKDEDRERDLLSTSRVISIIRMTADHALTMDVERLFYILESAPKYVVTKLPRVS